MEAKVSYRCALVRSPPGSPPSIILNASSTMSRKPSGSPSSFSSLMSLCGFTVGRDNAPDIDPPTGIDTPQSSGMNLSNFITALMLALSSLLSEPPRVASVIVLKSPSVKLTPAPSVRKSAHCVAMFTRAATPESTRPPVAISSFTHISTVSFMGPRAQTAPTAIKVIAVKFGRLLAGAATRRRPETAFIALFSKSALCFRSDKSCKLKVWVLHPGPQLSGAEYS
ncbi:hypothetical protein R80B4_02251 [Fibrobacteres bacterium R8-0-B4]